MKNCPKCGRQKYVTLDHCLCGYIYGPEEEKAAAPAPAASPSPAAPARPLRKCPACGEEDLHPDAYVCKHCGKQIRYKPFRIYGLWALPVWFGILFILAGFIVPPWFIWWIVGILLLILGVVMKKK